MALDLEDLKKRKEEQRQKDIESGTTREQWIAEHAERIAKARKEWGNGYWSGEPDYEAWEHEGFKCAVMRNDMGALCGYVGVPLGHPWHGADMRAWFADTFGHEMEHPLAGVEVHGGITYCEPCGRVLAVDPRNPWWWIGFDCAHAWDVVPAMERMGFGSDFDSIYRTFDYVKSEVNRLADQAKRAASKCPMCGDLEPGL